MKLSNSMQALGTVALLSMLIPAKSYSHDTPGNKVTTPKGTFSCQNSCVVDGDGNVSDCCGGEVWKKQADSIDG
jgi:hypothetical protein